MEQIYITRVEYESRHAELRKDIDALFESMDSINGKLDGIKIGTWKLIAVSAINFIVGSGITAFIESIARR